ncbi:MAG: Gfo/Idh/MocA family oxidoreductase [Chloroflexi bacterium]|nr:Gfo/Idh/MocA family oxidoreductase [Chloroflexota bacterium]
MVEFNWESPRRIRAGFIGAGGHSYRNVYPAFQYAPVELVALADHHADKAAAYARLFGAQRWYTDHREMLAKEQLDAVFLCVNFDAQGYPRYPALAAEALRAGCHVWMEKPPAATCAEIERLQQISAATGRRVAVGYKKMFFPAYEKVKEIISAPEFGGAQSASMRYRLTMPATAERHHMLAWRAFMDTCHPGSALHYLLGPAGELCYRRAANGDAVVTLVYAQGTVASLCLTGGQAETSPLERLEVVGQGANVVVENGIKLTYYRPGGMRGAGGYGRAPSYIGPDDRAPICWEPEFSLGQLYNKGLFMEGYVQQVDYFARCLLSGEEPTRGGLTDAWHITRLFEALRFGEPGEWIKL